MLGIFSSSMMILRGMEGVLPHTRMNPCGNGGTPVLLFAFTSCMETGRARITFGTLVLHIGAIYGIYL